MIMLRLSRYVPVDVKFFWKELRNVCYFFVYVTSKVIKVVIFFGRLFAALAGSDSPSESVSPGQQEAEPVAKVAAVVFQT